MTQVISDYSPVVSFTVSNDAFEGLEVGTVSLSELSRDNHFGHSVAVSGNGRTLVVGAPNAETFGVVYVFERIQANWVNTAKLYASDTPDGLLFGEKVALSEDGTRIAVSAQGFVSTGAVKTGAVFVYTRSELGWSRQPVVLPSEGLANQKFGVCLALSSDGKKLVAGGVNGDIAVYTVTDEATVKSTVLETVSSVTRNPSACINEDGSVVIVGTPSASSLRGSVRSYVLDAGSYVDNTLATNDLAANDLFGSASKLTATGDTLVVSAPGQTSNRGSVYVFEKTGNSYTFLNKIIPIDGATGDMFGSSLALSSDGMKMVVGLPYKSVGGEQIGSAHYYVLDEDIYSRTHALQPMIGGEHRFGFDCALDEASGAAIIGAPQATDAAGRVYIYR